MSLLSWLNADLFSTLRDKVNACITAVNATAGGTTGQYLTKNSNTDFDVSWTTPTVKTVIITNWDWNMVTNPDIIVAHGLNYKKIRSISLVVRDDADVTYSFAPFLDPTPLLWVTLEATYIHLWRASGSFFDSVNFDSTGYNRGWITITYDPL